MIKGIATKLSKNWENENTLFCKFLMQRLFRKSPNFFNSKTPLFGINFHAPIQRPSTWFLLRDHSHTQACPYTNTFHIGYPPPPPRGHSRLFRHTSNKKAWMYDSHTQILDTSHCPYNYPWTTASLQMINIQPYLMPFKMVLSSLPHFPTLTCTVYWISWNDKTLPSLFWADGPSELAAVFTAW